MRRKVPDTWWGAIVVGVIAGGVAGTVCALLSDLGSSWSLAHHAFVDVPAAMAGGVVLCLLKHAHNMRRARQVV